MKRREIFTWLADKKELDIICLQESHSTQEEEERWKRKWKGMIHFNHGTRNQRRVAILLSQHLEMVVHKIERDTEGRIIDLEIKMENARFCLVNLSES